MNLIECSTNNQDGGTDCNVIPVDKELRRTKREVAGVNRAVMRAKRQMCSACGCPPLSRRHFGTLNNLNSKMLKSAEF